ncbi:MAG: phenylalanine--tRNA ligase subunit alpha, partial [Clostridia bacterium]|nr:phenylalanine--tRNA ligase subunit alpha [Clostridia bacterium]
LNKEFSILELNEIKTKFLGKNGDITNLLKELKTVPPEEKPTIGKQINDIRNKISTFLNEKEQKLLLDIKNKKLESEKIDVTLSKNSFAIGANHPLTIIKNQLVDCFLGLGFSIGEGPEIELDKFNFQLLNIPEDHPARDMQDTFYISNNLLLRTQTSAIQARVMTTTKPPIRIICPGKVYRADSDATHSPMFQQLEGLVVDKDITLCDLKGSLDEFAKVFFGKDTKTRLRPSFFPFTEPSVEMDVSCFMCKGKGCNLCKGTGWIEILGAGIVNPIVLEQCGIDSNVYSGFAFGIGIERCCMLKFGIPDIRILFDNDIRFLNQYR